MMLFFIMTYQDVINSTPLKNLNKALFGAKKTEVIKRPACFIVRLKRETDNIIMRIILLPPNGFTANSINEMNPHPEARMAKIIIKGAIRPNKKSFSILKGALKFVYSTSRNISTKKSEPYVMIDSSRDITYEAIKSAKDKFFVVREGGFGFYHNLINVSNDWLVLILEKQLRSGKEVNLGSKIKNFNQAHRLIIAPLFNQIKLLGDKLFKQKEPLIIKALNLDTDIIVPSLLEMLNIYETGKHEPCTVFALILKKGKQDRLRTIYYLKQALNRHSAPKYYIQELIDKLS